MQTNTKSPLAARVATFNAAKAAAAPQPVQSQVQGHDQAMHSPNSERSVICAVLTESRAGIARNLAAQLSDSDFFEEAHKNIWRCRASLADAGVAHDFTAILDASRRMGLSIGGPAYVLGLMRDDTLNTNSDEALQAAASRIKDFSVRRTLHGIFNSALARCTDPTQNTAALITDASDALENLRRASTSNNAGLVHVISFVDAVTQQVAMRVDGQEPDNAVTTGFESIDQKIIGLCDDDFVLIGARPSIGKTAFSLAMAEANATAQHSARHVLYFSTEQGGTALARRMIASSARIDAVNLRRGELGDDELSRFFEGARTVGDMNLYIDETSAITLPEIRARARLFKQRFPGVKLAIYVDYLQRIKPHRVGEPRVIVGEISTGLKDLAKELHSPVVALAQLSRGVELRADKRPMLSDLGESGQLERDADIIMFLYSDEKYNPNTREPGILEVITAKNRDGGIGVSKLAFNKRTQRFSDTNSYDD